VRGIRFARIFWISAAAILVVAALVAISALFRADFTETDGQVLLTLAALLLSSATAVAGLTLVERGLSGAGVTAIVVGAVSFLFISASIWEGFDDEFLAKVAGTSALVLIATLLIATQLLRHRGDLAVVVLLSSAALALAAIASSIGLWQEHSSDDTWKVAGSLWIVGGVGWLLLPVLQRFSDASIAPAVEQRVIAELDGVEIIATRSGEGLEIELDPGERLVLRRRI
jgi:hypothetical protein